MPILKDTTHIEIRGNEVCLIRTQVHKRVSTEEFSRKMSEIRPLNSGLQPRNCIYYQRWSRGNAPHSLYVIEWEPRRVSLNYHFREYGSLQEPTLYEVTFPFTQWYFHCISDRVMRLHVSCTASRIKQLDDKLFEMPLPNQDTTGFCQGEVGAKADLPCYLQCEQYLTDIITSIWNDDLRPNWCNFGIEDAEAQKDARDAYDNFRTKFGAESSRLKKAFVSAKENAKTKEQVGEAIKLRTAHDAFCSTFNEKERPFALAVSESRGIPVWAAKCKAEGEEFWRQLLKRDHFCGTFAKFVQHLCGGGG